MAETTPIGETLRFRVMSQSRAGDEVEKIVRLTIKAGKTGAERLKSAGLTLQSAGDKVMLRTVDFGSEAAKYGLAGGDEVTATLTAADRPSRYWFAIPGFALLAGIIMLQRRRRQPPLKVSVAY
jgi:hypothetical protein